MGNKKILTLIGLMIFALILGACGSKDDKDAGNASNDNVNAENDGSKDGNDSDEGSAGQSEYEANLAEADEVAREALEALMTVDYNKLYDLASPSLIEQLEGNSEEDSYVFEDYDPKDSPKVEHGVKLHDDFYRFQRYDTLYDEEQGVFWYRVQVLKPTTTYFHEETNDPNFVITENYDVLTEVSLTDYYFGVKKNEGKFVVSEIMNYLDSHKLITEKEADMAKESAYDIHERVPDSKLAEVYGDDSDIGF